MNTRQTRRMLCRGRHRQRGAAAILAMMFLVIFSSLAAAMAIVAQGNLASADSYIKINRSLAGAETGMRYMFYRINTAAPTVTTKAGLIDSSNASALWATLRTKLMTSMSGELHNISEPVLVGNGMQVGPIAVGPGEPAFTATLQPHPLTGENYDSAYYQRPPFNAMSPKVSAAAPLDATWIRLKVICSDGPAGKQLTRSIQVDLKLDKKIKYAVLSKTRLMIGQNVMIQGPVGSKFMDTQFANGHPVQVQSDFTGLDPTLDSQLTAFYNTVKTNDKNGDNRINLLDSSETAGITNPAQYDKNGDGYIDDFDFFLGFFDKTNKGYVTANDLNTVSDARKAQLFALMDTFGDTTRTGYNDGKIDANDRYAKIRGQVLILAKSQDWNAGAGGGNYQQYDQGPVIPDQGKAPTTFEATDLANYTLTASDFDVSTYKTKATGDLAAQAAAQAALNVPGNPASPQPLGTQVFEAMPYGSAHPLDYYYRPVYKNMTFTNVKIPKGTNALFVNCKFIGCTFVESESGNTDVNYNYAGMLEADGTQKHPDKFAYVSGNSVTDTKTISNNVRFDGCTFEGAVVTDVTTNFTQARNKLQFTGATKFDPNASSLTATEKALYARSSLLAPQYSLEVGTFTDPNNASATVNLTGTIVAGVMDLRGQVSVDGSILTTFEPKAGVAPMLGNETPDYSTTLGYFSSAQGDKKAELPAASVGLGIIKVRYNANRALPDGILGPIQLTPMMSTYTEGG